LRTGRATGQPAPSQAPAAASRPAPPPSAVHKDPCCELLQSSLLLIPLDSISKGDKKRTSSSVASDVLGAAAASTSKGGGAALRFEEIEDDID